MIYCTHKEVTLNTGWELDLVLHVFCTLCLDENNLAPSDNQEQKGNNSTALGAGIGVSVAVVLIVVVVVVFVVLRKRRAKQKYVTSIPQSHRKN